MRFFSSHAQFVQKCTSRNAHRKMHFYNYNHDIMFYLHLIVQTHQKFLTKSLKNFSEK